MAIRGAKLTFGGGVNFLGVQKLQGVQKAYKKNQKKSVDLFYYFFLTVKILYFVGAPYEFSGRAPLKLVTPLLERF